MSVCQSRGYHFRKWLSERVGSRVKTRTDMHQASVTGNWRFLTIHSTGSGMFIFPDKHRNECVQGGEMPVTVLILETDGFIRVETGLWLCSFWRRVFYRFALQGEPGPGFLSERLGEQQHQGHMLNAEAESNTQINARSGPELSPHTPQPSQYLLRNYMPHTPSGTSGYWHPGWKESVWWCWSACISQRKLATRRTRSLTTDQTVWPRENSSHL